MTWVLLFSLTVLVVLLPMWPAIREWRHPSDVVPLYIDSEDALDPGWLARSFAAHLTTALTLGQDHIGRSPIASLPPGPPNAPWPLNDEERRSGSSRRVWHAAGDLALPADISFLAEVATRGHLRTAPGGMYRALWAGRRLLLAPHSTVLRWAHGAQIDVASDSRLDGRVSADDVITVAGNVAFRLLHAPTVRFLPGRSVAGEPAPEHAMVRQALPASVRWDAEARRGIADADLEIGDYSAWHGDLVGYADLWLGAGCEAHGSLKARGGIALDAFGRVHGNVVAEGGIELAAGCAVRGSVISETSIVLGAGCVVGSPDAPCTVAAPRIEVARGVVVHGTLWAGEAGWAQPPVAAAGAAGTTATGARRNAPRPAVVGPADASAGARIASAGADPDTDAEAVARRRPNGRADGPGRAQDRHRDPGDDSDHGHGGARIHSDHELDHDQDPDRTADARAATPRPGATA